MSVADDPQTKHLSTRHRPLYALLHIFLGAKGHNHINYICELILDIRVGRNTLPEEQNLQVHSNCVEGGMELCCCFLIWKIMRSAEFEFVILRCCNSV